MSRKRQPEAEAEGNNGAWFLDMLGIDARHVIPTPRRPRDEFEVPVLPPSSSDAETTTELVAQAWRQGTEPDPLADWVPHELARQVTSKRNFRWTVIFAMAIAAAVVIGAVLWLPSIVRHRANVRADQYRTAVFDLRNDLPSAQGALATATDPEATQEELSELVGPLTDLASLADRLGNVVDAPLPEAPPLLPSGPIDELVPIQDRLGPLAGQATSIQQRITDLVDYRISLAGVIALPDLPVEADASQINELRVTLAAFHANGLGTVNDMTPDEVLTEHLGDVRAALDHFSEWQTDYLEALRQGDDPTALIDDITTTFEDLDHTIVPALAAIRSETDTNILDLAQALDNALVVIPD